MKKINLYNNVNGQAFQLKSSEEFAARSNSVFDALNPLEKHHVNWQTKENLVSASRERKIPLTRFDDIPGQFKKPMIPCSGKRKLVIGKEPEFRRDPQKWVKYSLADVTDTSDEANTAIAMSFLSDIRGRRRSGTESFDKCLNTSPNENTDRDCVVTKMRKVAATSSSFQYDVNMMPEYVVNEKKRRESKRLSVKERIDGSKIKLGHIEDHFLAEDK